MEYIEVNLGQVDFYGEIATALREIYDNGEWKFVIMVENRRIVMMSY